MDQRVAEVCTFSHIIDHEPDKRLARNIILHVIGQSPDPSEFNMTHADEISAYLRLVRRFPRPTNDQMRAFAHHVSIDHSWYKHLPETGAGEPFFLWLKPHAHEVPVEQLDGAQVWRPIVRVRPDPTDAIRISRMAVALEAGDTGPTTKDPIDWVAGGWTTAEWRERYRLFSYRNHGPPDQPRADALASAAQRLRYGDDQVAAHAVPSEVLDTGLVYLRASIYPTESRHGRSRNETPVDDDRQRQLDEMVAAMRRVVDWVFGTIDDQE